ncbi:MAG: 1-acyl-sn-glycerol-3-phosphate acyltransferase [Planctomycetes bacterium]|nr:1-acyl-sn-glycerol-3-phosphate acyltransferase [Planctomycetota bacterium]
MRLAYRLIAGAACVWMKVFHFLASNGGERMPKTGGVLVVSNHASIYDPMALVPGLSRELTFLARGTLRGSLLYRLFTAAIRIVDIRRGEGDRGAIRAIEEALNRGEAVLMFPEGTRTQDGALQPFRGGIGMIVRATGVPVFPLYVEGTFQAWPKGKTLPRLFRKVRVRYGVPLDFAPGTSRDEITSRVEAAIRELAAGSPAAASRSDRSATPV